MIPEVASAERIVPAPVERVWLALVTPETHSAMMFGSAVEADWQIGAPIVWHGVWQGTVFTDHGEIAVLDAPHVLEFTHFSPLSGESDTPEHHHTIRITLQPEGDSTRVLLEQDNNPTAESAAHSASNWALALELLEQAIHAA